MIEIGLHQVIKNYGFSNVLSGLNLEIMTGDRLAIVGPNGSGKSTLLKLMTGEETPTQGTVSVRRGATLGYLEQIPRLLETTDTVRDVLLTPFGEALRTERHLRALEARMAAEEDAGALDRLMRQYAHHQAAFEAQGGYAMEETLSKMATGFGLAGLLDRAFNVLSGGQKTVVMLAAALLKKPDLLLLDEPTNHLDMRTLTWFEDLLQRYPGTIVMVSHDRYFLDRVANRTAILRHGACTVYGGNYTFSQQAQERELMREFEAFKNQQRQIEAMQTAIKRFRAWGAKGDNEDMYKKAKTLERRLSKMDVLQKPQTAGPKIPLHFAGDRSGREVLRLEDIVLAIGDLTLVQNASLVLRYQDRACLLGDNGAGKTSLIRALLGELPLAGGGMFIAPSAKIGYIPQEIRFANDNMALLEAFRAEVPCPEGHARGILAKYGFFGEQVFKRVSSLSGGEKVLLKLAILVQQEINLLILDEPTNHIDVQAREMLEEALLGFGGTLLFVSHDRYFIRRVAGRILLLADRRIAVFSSLEDAYCSAL